MKNQDISIEKTIVYGLDQLLSVAEIVRELLSHASVITFTGSLGAGKTTLIRELLRHCGVTEPITSPTFTYVNIYTNDRGEHFYHFDLYRIKSLEEFCMAGFDEYLFQPNSWAFIEWPEVIKPLLTHGVCEVALAYIDQQRRADIRCI